MNRIRKGFCLVPNPFNAKQISRVSLAPGQVDAFVFWSKNPKPMLARLPELDDHGFRYYFQFTLNDYPRVLEPAVPAVERRIDTFHCLAQALGPQRVVWRYDPILVTRTTDYDFHAATFERLAKALQGATRRVVLSIVDRYRKTDQHMAALNDPSLAITPDAPNAPRMLQLLRYMTEVAQAVGIQPFSCAEAQDFSAVGVRPGSCIDPELIATLGGSPATKKDLGQRTHCRCVVSRDIGSNDTCLFGCPYCYATRSDPLARARHAQHDPASPFLVAGNVGTPASADAPG